MIMQNWMNRLSKLLGADSAFGATIFIAAHYKALLRVVCDVCWKNRKHQPHIIICTNHLYTILSCLNKQLQDGGHALMKQLISFILMWFLWEAF
jgi:hypothetical protein